MPHSVFLLLQYSRHISWCTEAVQKLLISVFWSNEFWKLKNRISVKKQSIGKFCNSVRLHSAARLFGVFWKLSQLYCSINVWWPRMTFWLKWPPCALSIRRAQQPGHRGRSHERSAGSGKRAAEWKIWRLWLQQTGEIQQSTFAIASFYSSSFFEIWKHISHNWKWLINADRSLTAEQWQRQRQQGGCGGAHRRQLWQDGAAGWRCVDGGVFRPLVWTLQEVSWNLSLWRPPSEVKDHISTCLAKQ